MSKLPDAVRKELAGLIAKAEPCGKGRCFIHRNWPPQETHAK